MDLVSKYQGSEYREQADKQVKVLADQLTEREVELGLIKGKIWRLRRSSYRTNPLWQVSFPSKQQSTFGMVSSSFEFV